MDRTPGAAFSATQPEPPGQTRPGGMALAGAPSTTFGAPEEIYTSDCGPTSDSPASCLPRSVLHLSGDMKPLIPFKVLWDTGSSHCVMSPATARTLTGLCRARHRYGTWNCEGGRRLVDGNLRMDRGTASAPITTSRR